jgi:hypothetical protein
LSLVSVTAIAVVLAAQSASPSQIERSTDDAGVLKAIFEQTIVPEIKKRGSVADGAVALVADYSPMCRKSGPDAPCQVPDRWQSFLAPNRETGSPGLIENARERRELVESLRTRNSSGRKLPTISHPAIVWVSENREKQVRLRYARQPAAFCYLTLPGYSSRGRAVLFGSYSCGPRCGYLWVSVLKKAAGVWSVESTSVMGIG